MQSAADRLCHRSKTCICNVVQRCRGIAGQEMSNTAGHVAVQELDWSNLEHYAPVNPPFDYVLAADCVYHEQIVEDFLRTVLAMTHSKSTG